MLSSRWSSTLSHCRRDIHFLSSLLNRYAFYITSFRSETHTNTLVRTKKRVINNELAFRQTNLKNIISKKSFIWISSQIEPSSASASPSLLVCLYLSFQINDFGFCDAEDTAKTVAAVTTTTTLTLFHTIYHRIRFSRVWISSIWVICTCVRACAHSSVIHCCFLFLTCIHSTLTHNFLCFIFVYSTWIKSWCILNWSSLL